MKDREGKTTRKAVVVLANALKKWLKPSHVHTYSVMCQLGKAEVGGGVGSTRNSTEVEEYVLHVVN